METIVHGYFLLGPTEEHECGVSANDVLAFLENISHISFTEQDITAILKRLYSYHLILPVAYGSNRYRLNDLSLHDSNP